MVSTVQHLPLTGVLTEDDKRAWLERQAKHRSSAEVQQLADALELVAQLHGDAQAPGGVQWQLALLQTADTLGKLKLDTETLVAGLLSEATGSPAFDPALIEAKFGKTVLKMIRDMAVMRDLAITGSKDSDEKQSENLRRMLLGLADDVRTVLVVLAKRLRLMRALKYLPEEERAQIASLTLRIHAPLANRLGIWQLKWELEDLSLRFLHPDDYKEIATALESKRAEREAFIANFIQQIASACHEHGFEAEITGRPKHIYSIWKKMQRKRVGFDQIFDVRAVRVLVSSIPQCYEVLGMVHGTWQPIPGEFDDYIARPKANGYASLHTAVVGEDGKPMEVQIRTQDMHEHAERGVAAHWRYKEATKEQDNELERRIEWMRGFLEVKENTSSEMVAEIDADFEARRIYVLTPQGRVVELPKGATAVDFAYAVHSSVGDRCRGAKADGKIISLTHPLESGQTVEVLTAKEGGPSRDWLNPHSHYIVTSRARNRIRQWFKRQDYEQHVVIGKSALDKEVSRLGLRKQDHDKLPGRFNFKSLEEVHAAIGRGDLTSLQVANALAGQGAAEHKDVEIELTQKAQNRANKNHEKSGGQVLAAGIDDLMTNMAKCCKPVPYDPVIGYITKGKGLTIHRQDCPVVARMDEVQRRRLMPVAWSEHQPQSAFLVDIGIHAADRKGLLRDISSVFSNDEIDVLGVNLSSDRRKETADMRFTVEVKDVAQLSRVMEKLAQVPDVLDVRRQM